MIDLSISNNKLLDRALRILRDLGGSNRDDGLRLSYDSEYKRRDELLSNNGGRRKNKNIIEDESDVGLMGQFLSSSLGTKSIPLKSSLINLYSIPSFVL